MKERIVITYTIQNIPNDKTQCSFFMAADKSLGIPLAQLIKSFPPLLNGEHPGKYYHFRFLDKFGGRLKCWVDINNFEAKVPINKNNEVYVKVLLLDKKEKSKIFKKFDVNNYTKPNETQSVTLVPSPKLMHKEVVLVDDPESIKSNVLKKDSPENIIPPKPSTPRPAKTSGKASNESNLLDGHDDEIITEKQTETPKQHLEMFNFDIVPDKDKMKAPSTLPTNSGGSKVVNSTMTRDQREQLHLVFQSSVASARQQLEPFVNKWAYIIDPLNRDEFNNPKKVMKNIRILLSTLHVFLQEVWPDCDWTPITMADLFKDSSIKKYYMKVLLKFSRDKNMDITDPMKVSIMERICDVIGEARSEFDKTKRS